MDHDMDARLQSKRVNVLSGDAVHYLEMGSGKPMLFLHGVPTSSFLWRKVMPLLAEDARCIAPDLIGMGESDKPDIEYRVFDHIRYIESFIEMLDLRELTLVLHGWGSVIGFEIARRHPERIRAIAFFESHVRAATRWDMVSLPVQELVMPYRSNAISREDFIHDNDFLNKLLPMGSVCPLMEKTLDHYRQPYTTPSSRLPLWQYLNDLPTGDGPEDVVELIDTYSAWLQQSSIPKLMMYALPGFITTMETVGWTKDHLPELTLVELDQAMHFAQESMPGLFAYELKQWYRSLDEC